MRTSFLGQVHFMPSKYDPGTRAKAVRLVMEHREDYPSEWAAITAVSKRLGMNAETLRNWLRQQQVDDGTAEAAPRRMRRTAGAPVFGHHPLLTHTRPSSMVSGEGKSHLSTVPASRVERWFPGLLRMSTDRQRWLVSRP
jgi:transposase-like protein